MITLNDLITSSGKYKERANSAELTDEKKKAGEALLKKVNACLEELKIEKVSVSSGFRTSESNAATPGSAKKSNHMTMHAVDLVDADGKLDALFLKNIDILKKHGLYLESPEHTKGWSHLQDIATKNNPFLP